MSVFFAFFRFFSQNFGEIRLFNQVWKRLLVDGLDFSEFWGQRTKRFVYRETRFPYFLKSDRKSISEQVNKVPALHNFKKILRPSKFLLDEKVANVVYVKKE